MAFFLPEQHTPRFSCRFPKTACGPLLLLALLALSLAPAPACSQPAPQLFTYRPVEVSGTSEGRFVITSGEQVELTVFGSNLNNDTVIKFTRSPETCSFSEVDLIGGGPITLLNQGVTNSEATNSTRPQSEHIQTASLTVQFQSSSTITLYFCVFGGSEDAQGSVPVHQGSEAWLTLEVHPSLLPLWTEIFFIIILMVLSGLFSGLNLGLMSLDPTTLKIVTDSGTKRQRIYAKLIYRVRRHGNYLLCTLLLGNVLVNSTLTILLDEVLPSGIYAVVASTLAIVIFGEIIPQAICSRHGLVVGAWTMPLTVIFMVLTFPLSLPLSLVLNLVLGKEIGSVYNRDQLLKLLHVTKEHHDLENDEVDIISGVLGYKKKLAKDVMTHFEGIFCVSINSVLDFNLMREIYDSGFSRIPIYEDTKENIVNLLYVRDLAFVDPDDRTTLASHVQFYQHELLFFFEDTPLDTILKRFLEGKCHLAVIQTVREEPDKDPVYVAVGVVTLEDILEEILQREIVDETDRFVDNRTYQPRKSAKLVDVGEIAGVVTNSLTMQQRLAVYQFLSTEVEPFKPSHMSATVLKRLLTQRDIVSTLIAEEYRSKNRNLYTLDTPTSVFCLILEGCMEVEIGKDGLRFESRSFSYFGAQALLDVDENVQSEYRPDFTARPLTDCLVIIITRAQYAIAHRASLFEGGKNTPNISGGRGGGGGGGGGSGGGAGGTSGAVADGQGSVEWTKGSEALTYSEPNIKTSKGAGFSLFRGKQQGGVFSAKRGSDQVYLLSSHTPEEAESPVVDHRHYSTPPDIFVEMDSPAQDSFGESPFTTPQRLGHSDQLGVGSAGTNHSMANQSTAM